MRDLAADVAKLRLDQDMITAEQKLLPFMQAFHFQPAVEALNAAITAQWRFDCCAYYRPRDGIVICVDACANIGTAYRAWSYPGYTVDRTPYGVLAHETGHHVDFLKGENKGTYWSELSSDMRSIANEDPLTGYCPNNAEWFAEMMRLFITNPSLLQALRPNTYAALYARGLRPVFGDEWRARLAGAPARTLVAAERKVAKCARR